MRRFTVNRPKPGRRANIPFALAGAILFPIFAASAAAAGKPRRPEAVREPGAESCHRGLCFSIGVSAESELESAVELLQDDLARHAAAAPGSGAASHERYVARDG